MTVQLTQRQQQILRATVNHYIVTAEPVGSKALAQEYSLSVSPATIRNVMGMLENVGLLYQPHISAGRVPSDSGYRIYVDTLMVPAEPLQEKVEQLLDQRPTHLNFEALLRHSAQILSTLSGCVALVTRPQAQTTTVRHLQLVPVEDHRVMVIVVMDTYKTESMLMELPPSEEGSDRELVDQDLQILANFLNHELQGKSLCDLATLDWQALDHEFQRYATALQSLLADLTHRAAPTPFLIGGLAEVLCQPEFTEIHQVHPLIHLLEEKQDQLWPLICEWSQAPEKYQTPRVNVRIGAENPIDSIQGCALVSSSYQKGDTTIGSVGVLGPTRMAYAKVMALVEATANYLSNVLSQPA